MIDLGILNLLLFNLLARCSKTGIIKNNNNNKKQQRKKTTGEKNKATLFFISPGHATVGSCIWLQGQLLCYHLILNLSNGNHPDKLCLRAALLVLVLVMVFFCFVLFCFQDYFSFVVRVRHRNPMKLTFKLIISKSAHSR